MKNNLFSPRIAAPAVCLGALIQAALCLPPAQAAATGTAPTPTDPDRVPVEITVRDGMLELPDGKKTEATIGKIMDVLLDRTPDLSVVLAPGVADVRVSDLRLRSPELRSLLEGLSVATQGRVQPAAVGERSFALGLEPGAGRPPAVLEAFNLSGYFERVGATEPELKHRRVRELEELLNRTAAMLGELNQWQQQGLLGVQFHEGTGLVIVIGTPEYLESARQILNAIGSVGPQVPGGTVRRFDPYGGGMMGGYGGGDFGTGAVPAQPPVPAPPAPMPRPAPAGPIRPNSP